MLDALVPLVADSSSWTEVKAIMAQFLKHQCCSQQVALAGRFSGAFKTAKDA